MATLYHGEGYINHLRCLAGLAKSAVPVPFSFCAPGLYSVIVLLLFKMKSWILSSLLALAATVQGVTVWQQRNVTFDVADSSLGLFSSTNFTTKSDALSSFEATFGSSKISRSGDVRYGATIARVWTDQRKVWPELILYPESAEDVSVIMQFYSAAHSFWGDDGFAISMCLFSSCPDYIAKLYIHSGRRSCRFWRSTVS